MSVYSKAIGAFLTGLVGLLTTFGVGEAEAITPEMISAVTMILSTGIVYFVKND